MDYRARTEFAYGAQITCPECGKEFYCYNLGGWAYKRDDRYLRKTFCSWGCMRKYDKRKEQMNEEAKHKRKGRA